MSAVLFRNKRGSEMTIDNILGLVIFALGACLIFFLLRILIGAFYDEGIEGSNAYFETFIDQVEIAKEGGTGNFILWQTEDDPEYEWFLVYFGGRYRIEFGDRVFASSGSDNRVCICHYNGLVANCTDDSCQSLDYPMVLSGEEDSEWIVTVGQEILIVLDEENEQYVVDIVNEYGTDSDEYEEGYFEGAEKTDDAKTYESLDKEGFELAFSGEGIYDIWYEGDNTGFYIEVDEDIAEVKENMYDTAVSEEFGEGEKIVILPSFERTIVYAGITLDSLNDYVFDFEEGELIKNEE